MVVRIVLFFIFVIFGVNVFGMKNSSLEGFVRYAFDEVSHEVEFKEGVDNNKGENKYNISDFKYVKGGELGEDESCTWGIFKITKKDDQNTGRTKEKIVYIKDINSIRACGPFYIEGCRITDIKVLCCDTSKVTSMSKMFYGCMSLKSLPDISKCNIKSRNYMSYDCINCLNSK